MNSRQEAAPAALQGLRVLECGTGVSAPFCARLLADFGAEVIKVEPPRGDPLRWHGPFPADAPDPERSALFAYVNAGKQSVVLGTDGKGREELLSRLAAADVLVTNLPPAERARWGLDVGGVAAANPHLVVVALSELGESGPWSHYRAYEIQVCALAGASVILGEPGRTPLHFPFSLPALQAGMHAAAAALSALLARRRCGRGQGVEIAEADVLAYYCGGMSLFVLGSGGKWCRRGLERHGAIYPSGFYPCQDGFIFIAAQTRAQWEGFLQLMGDPAWAREDPALRDGVAIGWRRADEVDVHFIPWLVQHTRREITEMARQRDLVLGPVHTVGELLVEPHLEARGFWTETEIGGTRLRLPGMGYKLSRTPGRLGPVPRLGAHTAGVSRAAAGGRPQAASSAAVPRRPLQGYRAIEFGWNWAGPLVGQVLADLGVEVIKVETRARLDFMRHWQHARAFFHNANRGKLSVTINIKKPGGTELVRRLAAHADIVFDNFAAGVMSRNGLGYEHLRQAKADIIVLSMAMAGQDGPLRHLRGFAPIATGFAGLETMVGYPETGPTGFQLLGLGDANAAVQGVVACLAALWHRECTGEGQFIDLSQIEAAAALVAEPLGDLQLNGRVAGPRANYHPWMAPHGIYPVKGEDQWVAVAAATDEEWLALAAVVGDPEWARDESLRTSAGRRRRRAELDARLAEWTARFERDQLVDTLQQAGVAAAPVLGIGELRTHPYFAGRRLVEEVESGAGKRELIYRTPWDLSLTAAGVDRPSPAIGAHNDYVLCELMGMSTDEAAALAEQGVVW